MSTDLIDHPAGGYRFLKGIEPYSSGVVSAPGYEIVRCTLAQPLPYREGFRRIAGVLERLGRPPQALCGVELRSPAPFSRIGFVEFNREYCTLLHERSLFTDGLNPVARTNVAPAWCAPPEPSLHAFSFTVPGGGAPTFVVAGAGELRSGPLLDARVVRPGESEPEAMAEKARYVVEVLSRRLAGLGVSWNEVTATDIYTVEAAEAALAGEVLPRIEAAARYGLCWHAARPPIDELVFEMDARGLRVERIGLDFLRED